MLNPIDFGGKPFHFIGIGGIGMSALAYILAKRNLPVSGSDIRLSHITERLREVGAHIFWSQDATNLEFFQTLSMVPLGVSEPDESIKPLSHSLISDSLPPKHPTADHLPQVICSTAINDTNSEYKAALDLGCPIFHRSDVLAAFIQSYRSIAVAGTHGKTTTSSLIGYLLLEAGLDPTIVVGGEVNAWDGNARVGESDYLVAEADESDGSLARLAPAIGIITNIELDHPDHYQTLEQVIGTFQTFASQCETVIACLDCATIRANLSPTITYSLDPNSGADYTVDQIRYNADGTLARVWERGALLGQLHLSLLGQHNLSNALSAIAVGRLLGLDFATICRAMGSFEGANRRFEIRGEFNNILFVDDYAHHPSELRATLSAARLRLQGSPYQRVVAVFQPHRYSRTQAFLEDFASSFKDADVVVMTDVYAAGESNVSGISGQQVAELLKTQHSTVYYQPSLAMVVADLPQIIQPGDIVLFLGAGNLNQIIPEVMGQFSENKPDSSKAPFYPSSANVRADAINPLILTPRSA